MSDSGKRSLDEILDQALLGTPNEVCEAMLRQLGVEQTKKVARALDKRLRNIKPDCPDCEGTGFRSVQLTTACGIPLFGGKSKIKCDCGPKAAALVDKSQVVTDRAPGEVHCQGGETSA